MTCTEIVLTSRHQRVLGVTLLRTKALRCSCPSSSCVPKAAHTCYVLLHVGYVSGYVLLRFRLRIATFPATCRLRVGYKAAGPNPFWHQRMRLAHVRSRDDGRARTASCQINPGCTWPRCGPSSFCQPFLPD